MPYHIFQSIMLHKYCGNLYRNFQLLACVLVPGSYSRFIFMHGHYHVISWYLAPVNRACPFVAFFLQAAAVYYFNTDTELV